MRDFQSHHYFKELEKIYILIHFSTFMLILVKNVLRLIEAKNNNKFYTQYSIAVGNGNCWVTSIRGRINLNPSFIMTPHFFPSKLHMMLLLVYAYGKYTKLFFVLTRIFLLQICCCDIFTPILLYSSS